MTNNFLMPMILLFFIIVTPLSAAEEPHTSDVEIGIADFDTMYFNVTISNPDQKFLTLTSIKYSISDPSGSLSSKKSLSINGNEEVITASITNKIYNIDEFYRSGSKDVTFSGSISIEEETEIYSVPFHKSTTIFPINDEINRVSNLEFTDMEIDLEKLYDENGEIKDIIIYTNISIYNPNQIPIFLSSLDYKISDVYQEGEEFKIKKVISNGHYSTNQVIIDPMGYFIYSTKKKTTKDFFGDIFEHLLIKEIKYIEIEGSATLIPTEIGWYPNYFQSGFDTIILMNGSTGSSKNEISSISLPKSKNKSNISEEMVPTISTSTTEKSTPGFDFLLVVFVLFTGIFIFKRNN